MFGDASSLLVLPRYHVSPPRVHIVFWVGFCVRARLHAGAAQDAVLVRSVMFAHCVTAGVPLEFKATYGLVPDTPDWVADLYSWQRGYVEKIRRDLIASGYWDLWY